MNPVKKIIPRRQIHGIGILVRFSEVAGTEEKEDDIRLEAKGTAGLMFFMSMLIGVW